MNYKRKMILVLAVLIGLVSFSAAAFAQTDVKIIPWTLWKGDTDGVHTPCNGRMDFEKCPQEAVIRSVRSSDTSVLKVKKIDKKLLSGIQLIPVDTGKSKVTVRYKYKGKEYSVTAVYYVKEPDVFRYLKVNDKRIRQFDWDSLNKFNYRKRQVKISYKLKTGWKLEHREGVYYKNGVEKYFKPQNNVAVRFRKPKMFFQYVFKKSLRDFYMIGLGFLNE